MVWFVIICIVVIVWVALSSLKKSKPAKKSGTGSRGARQVTPREPRLEPSVQSKQVGREASSKKSAGKPELKWYGRGTTLSVGGFTLTDPHVYASPGSDFAGFSATDPSEILTWAEVRRPFHQTSPLNYWPWYSAIDPENRYLYLEWLASGKSKLPPSEGLLFLYYYGLERRLLVDQQDKGWVVREIARLRKLDEPRKGSKEGRSFRKYSSNLLWFEVSRTPDLFNEQAIATVSKLTEVWDETTLGAALAWHARGNLPLPSHLAMKAAKLEPMAVQSVVSKRVGKEFEELFHKRYNEQYGAGVKLRVSKRPFNHLYNPASGGLSPMSCLIPNASGISSQFKPLVAIWNSCIDDLRGFSRVAASMNGDLSVSAWESMPEELREGIDHPLAPAIRSAIAALGADGSEKPTQHRMISTQRVAELLAIDVRQRLTTAQSRKLVETVEHAGYCIEPDVRLTGRSYDWDEPLAIFTPCDDAKADPKRYLGATCLLHLGLSIAEADGTVDIEELSCLSEQVDALFQLTPSEKQRLEALRALLLQSGSDIAALTTRINDTVALDARRKIGRLLVAIAAASNGIDKREQSALRKCFRILGLPPELLEETIKVLSPEDESGFVSVASATPGAQGERLPAPMSMKLNREAISAIMAETREVALLLSSAMAEFDDSTDAEADASNERQESNTAVTTLPPPTSATGVQVPARYAAFWEQLVTQDRWSRDNAMALARSHNVMLDGAVESLNDWAYELYGSPCIEEDGDDLIVAPPTEPLKQ